MIRGIIWDIDGTLIDSMPIWDQLGVRYLRRNGIEPEEGLAGILFPMTLGEGVRYLKTRYHLPFSENEIRMDLTGIFESFYRYEVPLKKGVERLLQKISETGLPMVLATVGDRELEEAALRRLDIRKYFRRLFLCEDYHTTKKEAVIYQKAADDLGLVPEETLVVEDMYQAVHAAHGAGFAAAAVEDSSSAAWKEKIMAEADIYLPDYSDTAGFMKFLCNYSGHRCKRGSKKKTEWTGDLSRNRS